MNRHACCLRSPDFDQLVAHREHERLELGVDAELGEDVRDVVALGADGDVQSIRDALAVKALGKQLEHLALTRRELRDCVPILVLAFLGIFTFVNSWNDYLWPLVVLIDSHHVTLQVALAQLNGLYVKDYSVVMAGTLVAIVPLIVVFL